MVRPTRIVLFAAVATLVVAGCGPAEPHPDAMLRADGTQRYADGTFLVAYDTVDDTGWRPFIQARISAGLITSVCFDAVDRSGGLASADQRYREETRLATGEDLHGLLDALSASLVASQGMPPMVPAAAAAMWPWISSFLTLSESLFETLEEVDPAATPPRSGKDRVVRLVPMPGPFVAADEPDELGWYGTLITVWNTRVVAAHFDEYRRSGSGLIQVKSTDGGYLAGYADALGTSPAEVDATLVSQLTTEAEVDGISGATLTSDRFIALVRSIARRRFTPEIPRNPCDE